MLAVVSELFAAHERLNRFLGFDQSGSGFFAVGFDGFDLPHGIGCQLSYVIR